MRIAVVCQWFPPEVAPIGVMLTELCADLSREGHEVTVVTGFPNHPGGTVFGGYRKKGLLREERDGFAVLRCWLYTSPKKTFLRRLANYVTFSLSALAVLLRMERPDALLLVSPPLSNGLLGLAVKRLRGVPFVFNVQDIYPDAAVAAGYIRSPLLVRLLHRFERLVYRGAARVSVIGSGFRENLLRKGVPAGRIEVVRNWIDASRITALPRDNDFSRRHGLGGRFVVLYSGTIGLVSGAEVLLPCAEALSSVEEILFLFVGEGVVKERIAAAAEAKGLRNVRFLPFQPEEELSAVQSSADVSVVTLLPGGGSSVPSKVLGYMAAARPVVASADAGGDLRALVDEARCGIGVDAGDAEGLARAILSLYRDREGAARMGRAGREFLVAHCERKGATARYGRLFAALAKEGKG